MHLATVSNPYISMSQIDWELIIETIKDERCVLLIGPEFPKITSGKGVIDALLEFLDLPNDRHLSDLKFYPKDELFHYQDPIQRTRLYFKVKSFYRDIEAQLDYEPFDKIARIAIPLIISTTPDTFERAALERAGYGHTFQFYNKTINPEEFELPGKNHPLIYNLFGSIEEEQSILLSHDDLYDFIFAILGDRQLPGEIKKKLQDAANIIFLGFNFEKWYMQLLLRLLNLHDEKFMFDRYAATEEKNEEIQIFLYEQYRINFVKEDPYTFLDTLFQKCEEAGLLRTQERISQNIHEFVYELIEQDKLEQSLDLLSDYLKEHQEEDLLDDTVLLTSRYNRLQRKINEDIISSEQAEIELSKIRTAILELNKEVKELR